MKSGSLHKSPESLYIWHQDLYNRDLVSFIWHQDLNDLNTLIRG